MPFLNNSQVPGFYIGASDGKGVDGRWWACTSSHRWLMYNGLRHLPSFLVVHNLHHPMKNIKIGSLSLVILTMEYGSRSGSWSFMPVGFSKRKILQMVMFKNQCREIHSDFSCQFSQATFSAICLQIQHGSTTVRVREWCNLFKYNRIVWHIFHKELHNVYNII